MTASMPTLCNPIRQYREAARDKPRTRKSRRENGGPCADARHVVISWTGPSCPRITIIETGLLAPRALSRASRLLSGHVRAPGRRRGRHDRLIDVVSIPMAIRFPIPPRLQAILITGSSDRRV